MGAGHTSAGAVGRVRAGSAWTYLAEVIRQAATTGGPILECGSGLSTILLAALARSRGVVLWTLEHDGRWLKRTAAVLAPLRAARVVPCLALLRDCGGYSWYDPPLGRMPGRFRLVICDGPPGDSPGGRYGLLAVMGSRLAPGAVILVDDADRASDMEVLARWSREWGAVVEDRTTAAGSYAVVTMPAAPNA